MNPMSQIPRAHPVAGVFLLVSAAKGPTIGGSDPQPNHEHLSKLPETLVLGQVCYSGGIGRLFCAETSPVTFGIFTDSKAQSSISMDRLHRNPTDTLRAKEDGLPSQTKKEKTWKSSQPDPKRNERYSPQLPQHAMVDSQYNGRSLLRYFPCITRYHCVIESGPGTVQDRHGVSLTRCPLFN